MRVRVRWCRHACAKAKGESAYYLTLTLSVRGWVAKVERVWVDLILIRGCIGL
jgi:hypothetical protein